MTNIRQLLANNILKKRKLLIKEFDKLGKRRVKYHIMIKCHQVNIQLH